MKTVTGNYLNIYTEVGCFDETDLDKQDIGLDIFILFADWCKWELDMDEVDRRARQAITNWKKTNYTPRKDMPNQSAMRFIDEKIKKVLQEEFEDEAVLIVVKEFEQTVSEI